MRAALEVFKYKYYRYLWISSALSFTAMQMQQVARALLAWDLTGSYGAIGLISLSFGLPMLLFSLVGGALSDRMEKRNLVLGTQVMNSMLAIAHAVPVMTGTMTIELLFVLGLVQGLGFALGMPARTPLMAEAVGPQNMMSAIAMSNAAMNATRLFGPAVAGVMVGIMGLESVYFTQAVLNVLAAVAILAVPVGLGVLTGHRPPPQPQGNMAVEIGRGLRYIVSTPQLRLLISMMFVICLFGMPYIMLLAGFVQEDLGQGDSAYGYMQSVSGIGAIVASIGIATLTGFDRKPLLQWAAGILSGVGLVTLALGSEYAGFTGALVATVLIGLTMTAYQTLNNTMMMDEADPQYYGRVMSVNMLTFSAMPLMALPLGWLADIFGAAEVFAAMGLIIIVCTIISGMVYPSYTFGRGQSATERRAQASRAEAAMAGDPAGGAGGGAG
jgi:MFS family permease